MGWVLLVVPGGMLAGWVGLRVFRRYQDLRIRQHRRSVAWREYRESRRGR